MDGTLRTLTLMVCALSIFCTFLRTVTARDDPLEVLWITDSTWLRHDVELLVGEPMVDPLIVLSRGEGVSGLTRLDVLRTVRRYFPRTYEKLVEGFEFIVLKSMEPAHFTRAHLEWMRSAMEVEGLGGITEMYIARPSYVTTLAWAETPLSAAFPNDPSAVAAAGEGHDLVKGSFEMIINQDPTLPPVLQAYEGHLVRSLWYEAFRYMLPKQGARTYAWGKTDVITRFTASRKGTFHYLLGWQYGKAYTWSLGGVSGFGTFWSGEHEGRLYLGADAYFAMLLHSTGRGIPQDVVFVYRLKERFREYSTKQGYIISMVEFVEKFGANTDPLMVKVLAMGERWGQARGLYISQDYVGSWSLLDELLLGIDSFTEAALALKDRTLFWVYVVEWCVVTATFLLSGFLLWSLMVGRRLYRMVDQTRLRPPPGETGTGLPQQDGGRRHIPWWRRLGEQSPLALG